MFVKFWGVRGSLPMPLSADQVRGKIAAVVQRMRPRDLESAESRERFLAGLPPYLFGTIGGNTACLEIRTTRGIIIIDGGTGLRDLGLSLERRRDPTRNFPIFFTHFHWDHVQGIPFFGPAFVKGNRLTFASPFPSIERTIREQMRPPYFPVTMDIMPASLKFVYLQGDRVRVAGAEVQWKRMNHPGGAFAYRVTEKGKSVVFATDAEITDREFQQREENRSFFEGADVLILDAQYTLEESFSKFDFGHTSYTMAVNLATEWKVKKLVLYHFDPRYDDRKIWSIRRAAQWHGEQLGPGGPQILAAQEGLELSL
ncbi:MAG TPA: MBL fold metallo-hydrolase [Spirochaetia bacterium]|nr:MBL fold metallo-hydrolase [Spirochaetia bacterium]